MVHDFILSFGTKCPSLGKSLKNDGSTALLRMVASYDDLCAFKNGDDTAGSLEALQGVRTLAVSHAAKARLSIAPGRNAVAASTDAADPFV